MFAYALLIAVCAHSPLQICVFQGILEGLQFLKLTELKILRVLFILHLKAASETTYPS